jgi:hypothetical protein
MLDPFVIYNLTLAHYVGCIAKLTLMDVHIVPYPT